MEFSQKTVISGIVMPNNWDETGRVIGIALYTTSEEVYTLEQNRLTEELMNLMHQSVKVNGRIRQYPDGRKSIVADNYMR
jgi:hypothetical protein